MGGKHTGVCVTNSIEMHLMHDSKDLVSMEHKLVSHVIDGMQTNLSWENPLSGKLSKKFNALSIHSEESKMFRDSQCAVEFNSLGRYSAVIVILHFKRYPQISLANSAIFRF